MFTYAILAVKERITVTSSIWSTDSLTTAVLGSFTLNCFKNKTKYLEFQETFLIISDTSKKIYLSNQLRKNCCHIYNLHHLCRFHVHCMWWQHHMELLWKENRKMTSMTNLTVLTIKISFNLKKKSIYWSSHFRNIHRGINIFHHHHRCHDHCIPYSCCTELTTYKVVKKI